MARYSAHRVTRWVTAVALGLGVLVGGAGPASASTGGAPGVDWFGCQTAPIAESPGDGLSGWLLPAPKTAPATVDPGSGASLLQNYGVAGLSWFTFDDSCDFGIGGVTNAPGEATNGVATAVFLPGVLVAAGTVSAGNAFGNPDWLSFLNPVLGTITTALSKAFTAPLMPLFVLLTALVALIAASAGRLSHVLRALVFVLIGLGVVGLTVGYPVKAATAVDDSVSWLVLSGQQTVITGTSDATVSDADKEQPGAAIVGPLYKALVWDTWLRGQLGSDDSAVAIKYGYDLYDARTLTYTERAAVEADPSGAGKKIYAAKAAKFKDVADKIKAADPGAYEVLTTANFGQRFGLALGASMIAVTAFSIPFSSFVLLLLCFLYWRFTIMLGPILGAVMVLIPSTAKNVARKLGAVVLNTVMFGIGSAVYVTLARFITASTLPFGWQVLALAVLTVVGWLILHPIRAITKFTQVNTPGYDGVPGGPLARKIAGLGLQYLVTRKGVGDGLNDQGVNEGTDPAPAPGAEQPRPTHQWDDNTDPHDTPAGIDAPPTRQALPAAPIVYDGVILDRQTLPQQSTTVPSTRPCDVVQGTVIPPTPLRHNPPRQLPPGQGGEIEDPVPSRLATQSPRDGDETLTSVGDHDEPGGWTFYDAATKSFVTADGLNHEGGEGL